MRKKVLKITIMLIMFCFILGNICFAAALPDGFEGTMSGVSTADYGTLKISNILNTVINLIQYAGTGISVIMVTICGIKYMLASANERAELKKQMMPIVVGCIILFAAVNIVGIIADVGNGMNS